jgi:hypothetical protein
MDGMEFVEKMGLKEWDRRLYVMQIIFVSTILRLNDDGSGYNLSSMTKSEIMDLIENNLMTMTYTEEMKREIVNMFKIISEYGRDTRNANDKKRVV